MERRFEYQELGGKHGIFEGNLLVAVVGECFARPESAGDVAREIARVWNEHDTLVEQRDLLAQALELASKRLDFLTNWLENTYKAGRADVELGRKYAQAARDAHDNALATVEQGHEEQAGGGSERST